MSIDLKLSTLIDEDFLVKVDNIIGNGSKTKADTAPFRADKDFTRIREEIPSGSQEKPKWFSFWGSKKTPAPSEALAAQKIAAFVQDAIFKINWSYLSPEQQLDKVFHLQTALSSLQGRVSLKLGQLEEKRATIEKMNKFWQMFYKKPSSKEIEAHKEANSQLSLALTLLKELGDQAERQRILEAKVPIVPLSSQKHHVETLFMADSHFRDHQDLARSLYSKHVSTIPFIAMVRQLEQQPNGAQFGEPIKKALFTLPDIPSEEEHFLGVLDQEEIKKFNQGCISYLEERFGRELVYEVLGQAELSPFLSGKYEFSSGITYSVITGVAFFRLCHRIEKQKKINEVRAKEEREALIAKQKEEALLARQKEEREALILQEDSVTEENSVTSTTESEDPSPPPTLIETFTKMNISCPELGIKKMVSKWRSVEQQEAPPSSRTVSEGLGKMMGSARNITCPNLGIKKMVSTLKMPTFSIQTEPPKPLLNLEEDIL